MGGPCGVTGEFTSIQVLLDQSPPENWQVFSASKQSGKIGDIIITC